MQASNIGFTIERFTRPAESHFAQLPSILDSWHQSVLSWINRYADFVSSLTLRVSVTMKTQLQRSKSAVQ